MLEQQSPELPLRAAGKCSLFWLDVHLVLTRCIWAIVPLWVVSRVQILSLPTLGMAQLISAPQIFSELDQAGSMLARETQEDGLPMHDGKGDIHKCPFYAAQPDKGRLWVLS